MFEGLFETELVVSKELEEYLNGVIGFFDCGEEKYIGDDLITNLEQGRIKNTKDSIIALIQTFSVNNRNLGSSSPNHLRNMFPDGIMDSLDLEILINYCIIGVLTSTLVKTRNMQCHYHEKMLKTQGCKYEMNRRINKRAMFYGNYIESFISEKEQFIAKLKETGISSFDFTDPSIILYRKKMKTMRRNLNK